MPHFQSKSVPLYTTPDEKSGSAVIGFIAQTIHATILGLLARALVK